MKGPEKKKIIQWRLRDNDNPQDEEIQSHQTKA